MKKILVPVDFSVASRSANEYAASLALSLKWPLHLLHVYRDYLPLTQGPEPWTITVSKTHLRNEAMVNHELDRIKEAYQVEGDGDVRSGARGVTIAEVAEETGAGLIVMGMKGHQRNRLFGSTILRTIRKARVPVLIVPEGVSYKNFHDVVLAVDFNAMMRSSSLDPLLELVKKFQSVVRVLHVEEKNAPLKASEVPAKLQLGLALAKFTYLYEKLEENQVEKGIQKFVDRHPADLLVMVAHHHNIFQRVFGAVHTRSIGFSSRLPLLVLK